MSLTLRDGVYGVRQKLGEQIPAYWYTTDLIYDLNWAAQDMCSFAQSLESFVEETLKAGVGEVTLPVNMDQITDVGVFAGQLFQLEALSDFSDAQVANRVTGIPTGFYTKAQTDIMTPQGTPAASSGQIVPVQFPPFVGGQNVRTVLGLWPAPAGNYPLYVWGTRMHPWMKDPGNICHIPARFAHGWIAYGIARGKEKEEMLDSATYFQTMYEKIRQEYAFWCISRGQLKTPPSYGGTAYPTLARGSSSVIFIDQNPGLINQ